MPASINVLLVSGSPQWGRAVRAATAEIGGALIATPACARDALSLLVGRQSYSHLLVEPACAGELMGDFIGLTAGEAGSGTEMLLLGESDEPPPQVAVITSANRRSVARALSPRPYRRDDCAEMKPSELRQALSGCMIETRYQPIVRMADGAPVALEALARLNHPARGTLAPDLFVPQIEAAGLAAELTDAVASRAFADLSGPLLAERDLSLALNFSLDVLLVPEAMERLDARREEAGLDAGRIIIELTESRPVADLAGLRSATERLREAGYGLAIDDVGPAVPHHEAMLDLPFTAMKLDKTIVQQSGTCQEALDFLVRVIRSAKSRGLVVIAEGVEDVGTWKRMRQLGADDAQGFLVSRPLPPAALPIWLESWREQPRFE
jgi:EAL domain-containing protein (putative c-di-GMP-specific phosphodiesterase class I)